MTTRPTYLLPHHQALLNQRISELGLGAFSKAILASSYTSFRLIGDRQVNSRKMGVSRFGGDPDVPDDFDSSELEDLVFVYQVNLSDLPDGALLGLPDSGLLSIFADSDAEFGKTFFFETNSLVRHRMPPPEPDYIFSNMKPWSLKVGVSVDFPWYGDDTFDAICDAGLESAYEDLRENTLNTRQGACFGEVLGRFSDLNGDMREDAAEECGGKPQDWISLWKVLSSFESGLVISDFHLLHGMIRKRHLKSRNFSKMYSTSSNG